MAACNCPIENGVIVDDDIGVMTCPNLPDVHNAPCPYIIGPARPLFDGKFLGAREVPFKNPATGENGIWQIAYRTTKPANADVDGVMVVPIVKKYKGAHKYFLVIKEYRIPVQQWCIEFPAGMWDPHETLEACGVRELKEETGYTASRVLGCTDAISPLDPGITQCDGKLVIVEIDGDAPENIHPTQTLALGEFIEVLLVPCDELLQKLGEWGRLGYKIELSLYTFAIGYALRGNMEQLNL